MTTRHCQKCAEEYRRCIEEAGGPTTFGRIWGLSRQCIHNRCNGNAEVTQEAWAAIDTERMETGKPDEAPPPICTMCTTERRPLRV